MSNTEDTDREGRPINLMAEYIRLYCRQKHEIHHENFWLRLWQDSLLDKTPAPTVFDF